MLKLTLNELKDIAGKLSMFPISKMPGLPAIIAFHPGEELRITAVLDDTGRLDIKFPTIKESVEEMVGIDYSIFNNIASAFNSNETIEFSNNEMNVISQKGKVVLSQELKTKDSLGFYEFEVKEPEEADKIEFSDAIKSAIKDSSRHVRNQPNLLSCVFIDANGNFLSMSSTSYWYRGVLDRATTSPYTPLLTKLSLIGDSYADNGETSTIVCGMNWRAACRRYVGDAPMPPLHYEENLTIPNSESVVLTSVTMGDIINKVSLLFSEPNITLTTDSVISVKDYTTNIDMPIETVGTLSKDHKTGIEAYSTIFKEADSDKIKLMFTDRALVFVNETTKTVYFFRLMYTN